MATDLVLHNARITTLDRGKPAATALAIEDGLFSSVGQSEDILPLVGPSTQVIDAKGATVIPGLNDSHLHLIRGGLNFNLELRWDGLTSLAEGLRMLKDQARRTPPPQWVRVVGGWNSFQFAERRLPTLSEINEATGDTPCFILHLYDRALLNGAALRAVGYSKDTPDPPGGEMERDRQGNPTGLLLAKPNANILYSTLAKGPRLSYEDQLNSTRHFMREMNRLGLTSAIDAGGGYQNYPEDYQVVSQLESEGALTIRIAYNLFTQKPRHERDDFARWAKLAKPGSGNSWYRLNGAGEMLVFSAADFEDFLEPRPDLAATMEAELEDVVRLLAAHRWPFRLHATYEESIARFLDVFERVNRDIPFDGLHWFFDHAETITDRSMGRVAALGGGIAVQHRMAFQGEYFVDQYGAKAAERTPPVKRMLELGIPVGAGTDATRVASYNPWVSLYWLTSGRTVGGLRLYPEHNTLNREDALRLYTLGSSWFSTEDGLKGAIAPGQLADFAVLTGDYFSIPEADIPGLESQLTVVGGRIVYGAGDHAALAPTLPPISPDWSPVRHYGGYRNSQHVHRTRCDSLGDRHSHSEAGMLPGGLFCPCFAF
ncbi:MAG: amidohydrolase [Bryobacteraceae bacterium]|nr:amidohydrolase [Bryobacteraceae bacterium]